MNMPLSDQELDLIFRSARTAYDYRDREITTKQLHELWNLLKWGPTSANCMPARIVWCLSGDAKRKLAECASANNSPRVLNAPVTAIVGMELEFYERLPELYPAADARSWFVGNEQVIHDTAFRNSSLQGAYLIIAARALGLATGPMSGFDNAAVDRTFFSGTNIRSNFIMTLGYPDASTYRPRGPRLSFEEANQIA